MRMMIYSVWDRSVMCERGGKKLLLKTGSGCSQNWNNNENQESYLIAEILQFFWIFWIPPIALIFFSISGILLE